MTGRLRPDPLIPRGLCALLRGGRVLWIGLLPRVLARGDFDLALVNPQDLETLMTTTTMTILRPSGAVVVTPVALEERPEFERLRQLVEPHLDGGRLEHVTVLHDGQRRDMFVDEAGAGTLPRNPEATRIYRSNWLTQHPGADPETLPAVYGPAVLFSRQVWF